MRIRLSMVVIGCGIGCCLRRYLRSIHHTSRNLLIRAFIISGLSSSNSVTCLHRHFPRITFVRGGRGINFTHTGGRTVHVSSNGCILLLGPSAVIARRAFDSFVRFVSSRPRTNKTNTCVLHTSNAFTPRDQHTLPAPFITFYGVSKLTTLFPGSHLFNHCCVHCLSRGRIGRVRVVSNTFVFLHHRTLSGIKLLSRSFFVCNRSVSLSCHLLGKKCGGCFLPSEVLRCGKRDAMGDSCQCVCAFCRTVHLFFGGRCSRCSFVIDVPVALTV